jgi:ribosomal protein S18 acetylase RimI-like enzyme
MPTTIQQLTAADAAHLKPFRLHSLRSQPDAFHSTADEWDKPLGEFEEMITSNPHFAAFNDAGEIVGLAILGVTARPKRQMRHKCEIWSVFVNETARRQGLARKLVEACIAEAKSLGYDAILLTAAAHLTHVVVLYESLGFRIYGTEAGMVRLLDGREINNHLMELQLNP